MSSIYENSVVAAASATFCEKVREEYGDDYANIPHGQEESTLHALGAIVGRLADMHGLDSDEFKEAEAMYVQIVPAWTAFVYARDTAASK